MKRYDAIQMAKKFVSDFDHLLLKANLVGSLVRDHLEVSDVDILIISKKNIYHGPPLNLFHSSELEWESGVLHWAIGKAIIQYKARAKALKYKLTQHGLFKGQKLVTTNARQICSLLRMPVPNPVTNVLERGVGKLK